MLSLAMAAAVALEEPPWTRRVEHEGSVMLELASRRYVAQDRPDVWLVGVAHVADESFYEAISDLLAGTDLVLFESVAPSGSRSPDGDTPEERVESTTASIEFIVETAASAADEMEMLPETLEDVLLDAAILDARLPGWVDDASIDAWGRELVLAVDEDASTITITSLGSDGAEGGDGEAADLHATRAVDISPAEDEEATGEEAPVHIQRALADALGLVFQLEALPYDEPGWFCSDMTIDEVQTALHERGADTTVLDVMTESSIPAQVATTLMRMLPAMDAISGGAATETARLLLIEVLTMPGTDTIVAAIDPALHSVIIIERNARVLGDLEAVMSLQEDEETRVESVSVLYGAGHMPDLHLAMVSQLGYAPAEAIWIPAMSATLDETIFDERELKRLRFTLRYQMHKAAEAAAEQDDDQ